MNTYNKCPGSLICQQCFWLGNNGGKCSGCDSDYQQRCLKKICNFNCHSCSGGKHAVSSGVCGRTIVLWDHWEKHIKKILKTPTPPNPTQPITIHNKLIPIIYPQTKIREAKLPELFPQIDAWAVPIHKVMNAKGTFRTGDIKDYLSIPPDRKLILVTCAPDNYQEILWSESHKLDFQRLNIDYWFPAHFSIYDNDAKLYQFVSAKRQSLHAAWTQSQFIWFRLGEHISLDFIEPVRNSSSVLISTQQMYSQKNRTFLNNEVKIADKWFSKESRFFIIGKSKNLPVSGERALFEINSSWIIKALKGRTINNKTNPKSNINELLISNLNEVMNNV